MADTASGELTLLLGVFLEQLGVRLLTSQTIDSHHLSN